MSKLFQIYEEDLATLESELPRLLDAAYPTCNEPLVRKGWEAVRDIITKVRWNYGPPSHVEVQPASEHGAD